MGNIYDAQRRICRRLYPNELYQVKRRERKKLNLGKLHTFVLLRIAEMMVSSSAFSRSKNVVSNPWFSSATRRMYRKVPP